MESWDTAIYITRDIRDLGKTLIPYGLCILGDRPVQVAIGEKPHLVDGKMFARGTWVSKRIFYHSDEITLYRVQRELQNTA